MDGIEKIKEIKIVPVTVFKSINEVVPIITKLINGGIPLTEICFRTNIAEEAIKLANEKLGDRMLIGAGTIINKEQCERAIKAGAKFIVSPGFSSEVLKICNKNKIPYLPGVLTPTEIINCLEHGITYVKFFPAGVFGGLDAIKALAAAFPQVNFMPTGGVDLTNLKDFISNKNIFAIGGSFLLKGDIENNCTEALKIIKGE